jgi:hypothetical protein
MGKDCEGRVAGHHLTPGRGWRWQKFGDRLMLVTDGGGSDVVLSLIGPRAAKLATCSPDGLMRALTADHPLARLLEALPDLAGLALEIEARDDRPHYLPRLRAALAKAGLA